MFRFSAGSPSAPKASLIIGLNRVSPLSRHGYSGEYLANTPSTGREVWASEIRFCSLVSRKPAVTFDDASHDGERAAQLLVLVDERSCW